MFIHLFNKYLSSTYDISGTVLGLEETVVNRTRTPEVTEFCTLALFIEHSLETVAKDLRRQETRQCFGGKVKSRGVFLKS